MALRADTKQGAGFLSDTEEAQLAYGKISTGLSQRGGGALVL